MTVLPNPWTVPVVTIEVAGQLLGFSRAHAHRAAAAGDLPIITIGTARRVPVADLYRMLGLPVPPRPVTPAAFRG